MASAPLKSSDQDLSRVPPDELFTRFSVSAVRAFQHRLRTEADGKQEELRQMVGERYRDLLQASTSILSMSSRSQRVVSALDGLRDASIASNTTSVQPIPHPPRKGGKDDGQLDILQSLSAHLKLLMDVPEQLWRLLERHEYLHASWLFLVSRAVYRNLAKSDGFEEEDVEQPWLSKGIVIEGSFPLAHRQWDAINPFRHQIAHKATQDLRVSARTPRETCHTLMALLLLDSISISESVGVFQTQRSKALKSLISKLDMLAPILPEGTRPSSPSSQPDLGIAAASLARDMGSEHDRASRARRRESVTRLREALHEVLGLLVGTLETSRAVFGTEGLAEVPLVERVLESVQSGQTISRKYLKHKSHLSIISSFHATPSPISPISQTLSTTVILESLPSSQLLLQYLPPSVVSYSPYIDASSVAARLSEQDVTSARRLWFEESLSTLEAELRVWLTNLNVLSDVWDVRNVLLLYRTRISAEEFRAALRVFDTLCLQRGRTLWSASLNNIQDSFKIFLQKAEHDIKNGELFDQTDPARFISGPIPRSLFQSSSQSSSFVAFRKALDDRIAWRIPYLDNMESTFAKAVSELCNHFIHLQEDPLGSDFANRVDEEYSAASLNTCVQIGRILKARLEAIEVLAESPLHATAVAESLLVGRAARDLMSSHHTRLLCRQQVIPRDIQSQLQVVFESSLVLWERYVVDRGITTYQTAICDSTDGLAVHQPSSALIQALMMLLDEVQSLGLPFASAEFERLPAALLGGLLRSIEHLPIPPTFNRPQHEYDISFLQRLRVLSMPGGFEDDVNPSSSAEALAAIDSQIARIQLLLGPLVRRTLPSEVPLSGKPDRSTIALLPLGPPSQEDLTSILKLAKPGPRFGLLLVGGTAAK